jgi:pyruvate ferredoxin oxidoreductase gamma subunit
MDSLKGETAMIQARIHGRGGQGAVTAADLMAIAAFHAGRYSLSFPSFGSERMGAPVTAFVRIDDREIELREPILNPDLLIVLDPTLFHAVDVLAGLHPDGYVLVNSRKSMSALGLGDAAERLPVGHVVTIPATDLALKHVKLPKPNTVLVAAAAAMRTDLFDEPALARAIMEVFPGRVGELNLAAAREALEIMSSALQSSRAQCLGESACCSK